MEKIEFFFVKYGSYFLVALIAAGIGKMYSNEKETWFTIARSMLAAIGATYVVVLNGVKIDEVMLITEIFLICLVIDVFVKGIITAMNKIIPSIIDKIIGSFKQ